MLPGEKYEAVIGLEVHTQLLTKSKLFSGDSTEFGTLPNTNVSAISLAHPGTLPKLNKKVIEYALKLGIALDCEIVKNNYFARKNYFYPDLPKGYQISQYDRPLAVNGSLSIGEHPDGTPITVGITRLHLEEDAGKSIHDRYPASTAIDLNRSGIALMELL